MFYDNKVRKREAKKRYKLPRGKFTAVEGDKLANAPKWATRVFINNRYTVIIRDNRKLPNGSTAIVAMVQRLDDSPMINHWAEMQRIKNELFGPEVTAVECYPPESQLINDHNIYWLWVFENDPIPFPHTGRM